MLSEDVQDGVISTTKKTASTMFRELTNFFRYRMKTNAKSITDSSTPVVKQLSTTKEDAAKAKAYTKSPDESKSKKHNKNEATFERTSDVVKDTGTDFDVKRVTFDFVFKKYTKQAAEKNAAVANKGINRVFEDTSRLFR